MKKYLTCFALILCSAYSLAGQTNCPKEWSIHCVYNEQKNVHKWIKINMLPKDLTMIICFSENTAIYLEKDDIKQDALKPPVWLKWQYYQCQDARCSQQKLLAIDNFLLDKNNQHYFAQPAFFNLSIDAHYGENCIG